MTNALPEPPAGAAVETFEEIETVEDVELIDPTESIVLGEVVEPRRPVLGVMAIVVALASAVVHGVAVGVASRGEFATATVLGYTAIGLSILAIVAGVLAAILDRGRIAGIAAATVGLLANPYVLLVTLRLVSGFEA